MIIDGHCHAGRGTMFSGPWDTNASLEHYLRRASRAGITQTVLLPAFHENYAEANRALAEIVRRRPGRFIGFASVNPKKDKPRARELIGRAVRDFGFRGIKVHGHEGLLGREICDAAREFRVPILYDVAGKPGPMDLIAREYPGVNFIIPHLGSFADDYKAHTAVIDLITRHANVLADTSGVRRFDYLVEAVRRAGPTKIIFGTDGPWLHPALELQKIRLLGLPASDERLVLGGNLRRVLGQGAAAATRRPGTAPSPSAWSRPAGAHAAASP